MITTLNNGFLRVQIADLGAELQSVCTADGHEYLWQGDPTYWKGRAINLFPTVGRLEGAACSYEGETYAIGLHGFARHSVMAVSATETEAVFALEDSEETRKQYPFAFRFEVCYRLEGSSIYISYNVKNRGDKPMYFGLGGHPGFFVPMEEGRAFEEYRLRFPEAGQTQRVEFSSKGLVIREYPYPLEKGEISLSHGLFDNDAIVLRHSGHRVCLEHESGLGRAVEVEYPAMDYVGFWQADHTDAPYVCIEPWQSLPGRDGVAEDWARRPGMICLAPGEEYTNPWRVTLR